MFWYLEKDRPIHQMLDIQKIVRADKWDEVSKDEKAKIATQVGAWEQARGKYLFAPNLKLFKWYLQPHGIKASSAGNRAGKTSGICMDIIMQIEGWHPLQEENLKRLADEAIDTYKDLKGETHDVTWVRPFCQKLVLEKKWIPMPPIYARCVAPDFTTYVEKVIGPEYEKWSTKSMLKEVAYENQNKRIVKWQDGSFMEFMTIAQDVKVHGGAARHVIQVDEEIPIDFWTENNMRRISVNGRILYGATAIEGVTWTEEMIFQRGEQGDPTIYVMEMSTYDNPMNTDKVVKEILKQCADDTDVDIRIYGKRKRRGGNVYKMAKDEKPWVIPRFEIPRDKGLLLLGIDPHPQIEHAMLWQWADYDGLFHELIDGKPNIYNVGEVFEHGSPQEIKYYIDMMEVKLGRKHDHILCDPMAWDPDQRRPEDKIFADQLEDLGLFVQRGSKKRQDNIIRVGGLLTLWHKDMPTSELARSKGNPDMILKLYPDARPQLFTFDDLTATRLERRNWHFTVYKGKAAEEHEKIKPKPVDRADHFMENEGRLCAYIEDYNPDDLIQLPSEDQKTYVNDKGQVVDISFDDDDPVEFDYKDAILG
jgi:hypothetical protein